MKRLESVHFFPVHTENILCCGFLDSTHCFIVTIAVVVNNNFIIFVLSQCYPA